MHQSERPSIKEMLDIKSVAIVGVSANLGYYWAHSMLQWNHNLDVHLISLKPGEVLGKTIHPSLDDIQGTIDYAIIAVPYKHVPQTVRDVQKKGAKGATIFTSGFSELGTQEGLLRENELKTLVHSLPLRAFGPNCMGLMYPKLGFAFMPTVKRLAGNVGFLSQSGGVAIATYTAGVESGIGFSKLFSFGNQIDITPSELLDYFAADGETDVVGAYIEGTKEGREMLRALSDIALHKPVVVLKGGRSEEGSRAASSHTGALAGSRQIWDTVFTQANVQTVTTLEDLVATLSVFALCPSPKSRNVGLVAISGGTSVIYTDLCIEHGLNVPRTSEETVSKLDPLIQDVGTGLGNPIDLAADYYQDQTVSEVIDIVGQEPEFDSLILEADVHNMHQVATIMNAADALSDYWKAMARAGRRVSEKYGKPVLVAIPEVAYPQPRTEAWNIFVEEGLPVFRNVREGIAALSRACDYFEKKRRRLSTD
jgi:acyl-CoA synthetase (NDP forming)